MSRYKRYTIKIVSYMLIMCKFKTVHIRSTLVTTKIKKLLFWKFRIFRNSYLRYLN